MDKKANMENEPFWRDEENPYSTNLKTDWSGVPFGWFYKLVRFVSYLMLFSFMLLLVAAALQIPWLWILVIVEIIIIGGSLYGRKKQNSPQKADRIQQLAQERTRADLIGSAIHTAGHPRLKANQEVVLALKGAQLSIYGYDSPTPLDSMSVDEIESVDPVVVDDEGVPHVGVIDITAQALQLTFTRQNVVCMCAFRRMLKVRPIEWYDAIQKARIKGWGV